MTARVSKDRSSSAGPRSSAKKPELTDADKALLQAEPDWERMGEGAKRLLSTPPNREVVGKAVSPKRRID